MYLPDSLMEMGDIGPALQLLLRIQSEYARGVPGVTRAQRDVAEKALTDEIRRFILRRERLVKES